MNPFPIFISYLKFKKNTRICSTAGSIIEGGVSGKKWKYYQYRWENSIILKYFGWPIWGISVHHKKLTGSNFLISSFYLNKYREASHMLYTYAKGKSQFDDETEKYLERI
jgi:hypothetical protein